MPVVLAALPELLIGLVIALLIWAGRALFGQMLSSLASRIPLIGSTLGTLIDAIVTDVVDAGLAEADSLANYVIGFVLAPIYWIEHLIADGMDILQALRSVIEYVATTLISQAVSLAVTEARVLVAYATAQLEGLINAEFRIVQGEFAQVYATITAVEHALTSYIQAEISMVENQLEAAIRAETAFVVQEVTALEQQLEQAITAETTFVQDEVKSAIAYTQAVEASLIGTIDKDITDVTTWVTSQLVSLAGAVDLVQAATAAIAVSAAKAVETDLQNLKKDCTDNLCSGASGIANVVNGLLEQGFVAALLGYAAWGATDPKGCGNATADVLVPIASGAKDVVDSAIGAL